MLKLYKTTNSNAELLADQVEIADGFVSRAKGLLGRKLINQNQAMWLKPSNNIHTFFMKFPIDCIFLDRNMQIRNIVSNVRPFKFVGPFWKSFSVIEVQSGFVEAKKLKVGDHLYVVN